MSVTAPDTTSAMIWRDHSEISGISGLINHGDLNLTNSQLMWRRAGGLWRFFPGQREIQIDLLDIRKCELRVSGIFGDSIYVESRGGQWFDFKVGTNAYFWITGSLIVPLHVLYPEGNHSREAYTAIQEQLASAH